MHFAVSHNVYIKGERFILIDQAFMLQRNAKSVGLTFSVMLLCTIYHVSHVIWNLTTSLTEKVYSDIVVDWWNKQLHLISLKPPSKSSKCLLHGKKKPSRHVIPLNFAPPTQYIKYHLHRN